MAISHSKFNKLLLMTSLDVTRACVRGCRLYDKESKLMPPNDLTKCKSATTSPANSPPRLADDVADWNPFIDSETNDDFGQQFDKIKRFKGSNDSEL